MLQIFLLLWCGFSCASFAEDVKLRTRGLPHSGKVINPGISRHGEGWSLSTFWGVVVMPKRVLRLRTGTRGQDIRIQDASVNFKIRSDGRLRVSAPSGGCTVGPTAFGYEPATVALSPKTSYTIAIPRARSVLGHTMLYIRSGCVKQARIGKNLFTLYDCNMDGLYTAADDGCCHGDPGTVPVFAPLGEYIPSTGRLYRLSAISSDATKLTIQAYRGDTGKIRMQFSGEQENKQGCKIVLQHESKKLSVVLSSDDMNELTVLPGVYRLLHGVLFDKKDGVLISPIKPGAANGVIVKEGEMKIVQTGPFGINPLVAIDAGKAPAVLTFTEKQLVRGDAGERYDVGTVKSVHVGLKSLDQPHSMPMKKIQKKDGVYSIASRAENVNLWGRLELFGLVDTSRYGTLEFAKQIVVGMDLTPLRQAVRTQKLDTAEKILSKWKRSKDSCPDYVHRSKEIESLERSIAFSRSRQGRELLQEFRNLKAFIAQEAYTKARKSKQFIHKLLSGVNAPYTDTLTCRLMTDTVKAVDFIQGEAGAFQLLVSGLTYSFYDANPAGDELELYLEMEPKQTGTAKEINLVPAQKKEYFALVFRGFIRIPANGTYHFYTHSDDGSRLYIDEKPVVLNDDLHYMREKGGKIDLDAGYHSILVTYYNGPGGRGLEAKWQGPGINKQMIPSTVLFHRKK